MWEARRRWDRHGLGVVFLLILVYSFLSLSFLLDLLSSLFSVERLGGGEATLVCVLPMDTRLLLLVTNVPVSTVSCGSEGFGCRSCLPPSFPFPILYLPFRYTVRPLIPLFLIPASASSWRNSQLLNSIKLILIPASVSFLAKFATP